jgi:predicted dehydrogenase
MKTAQPEYGLSPQVESGSVPAPELPYLPPVPKRYRPKIGLIGAGGVSEYHLRAYRHLGLEVVAICDVDSRRAQLRQKQFYPEAETYTEFGEMMRRDDIEVIDVALHPEQRFPVLEAGIAAGKHILSQKPFALDLDAAERLLDLADRSGVRIAVNQNGRWAPHFSYAREVIRRGLLGEIGSLDFHLAFDHSWTAGTHFEDIHHLLLYDFGVHWFDLVASLPGEVAWETVYASVRRCSYQKPRPPFLAAVVIDAAGTQARLSFNAAVALGQSDRTFIAGSLGTLQSSGPSLSEQALVLTTAAGGACPVLAGTWFESGFQGAMGELLCAIEEGRDPIHSARQNLRTLALCFAALHSANTGLPVKPGSIRRLPLI